MSRSGKPLLVQVSFINGKECDECDSIQTIPSAMDLVTAICCPGNFSMAVVITYIQSEHTRFSLFQLKTAASKTPATPPAAAATQGEDKPTSAAAGASCTRGTCPRTCRTAASPPAHRHEWENVVIWVNNPAVANPTLLGGAASGHGGYSEKTTNPLRQGTRPKVEYFTNFPYNYELQFTHTLGRDLLLVAWDSLPVAAWRGLEMADFGKAIVLFKDASFRNDLAKAAL
ncbi:hypothetical protein CNMCM5793_003147 [Aspergillus hiratsukae]|uniref:Uncharacterized protein n=1 Tax=Aspergillus hiratsukae TaxID=1194566 RepID=A0A8H6UY33_9EURO|nr:hypothetical protein CNMCM5793_003147 [Aspergillus hiratsukae]KAF7171478.1 hypothetical protein CNMCM6106_005866 [Aspergillus hiratsukae]